jgi:hypothetical protein
MVHLLCLSVGLYLVGSKAGSNEVMGLGPAPGEEGHGQSRATGGRSGPSGNWYSLNRLWGSLA